MTLSLPAQSRLSAHRALLRATLAPSGPAYVADHRAASQAHAAALAQHEAHLDTLPPEDARAELEQLMAASGVHHVIE